MTKDPEKKLGLFEKARLLMIAPFTKRRREEPAAAPMETDGEAAGARMGTSGRVTPSREAQAETRDGPTAKARDRRVK